MGSTDMDRARLIFEWLKLSETGQLWLLPYHLDNHWMLIIIDLPRESCFFLDPIANPSPEDIKNVISMAFDYYNDWQKKRGRDSGIQWRAVKCNGKKSYMIEEINEMQNEWVDALYDLL
ncbi:Ulp1 protease family, C-terminal catalytic domain containing protein [Trema orientale]|uniref:Ulp1 protease family, C-terminal catalytic domain containing protein n=1 Tax=Trema orientale TaxID=63057 RepID=A0A2P5EEB9_TREOI|nr:Ulp1 protease family, C-terminal catalytic domain containing protein [Trema orientale]